MKEHARIISDLPVRFLADEDCDFLVVRALRAAGREYENVGSPILCQIAVTTGVLIVAF